MTRAFDRAAERRLLDEWTDTVRFDAEPDGIPALLPEDDDEPGGEPVVAATEPVHTGAMIALLPSEADAQRLLVDGGEPLDELHCTLAYLGEAADIPDAARAALVERIREALQGWPVVDGDGFAVNLFNPGDTNDHEPCIVLGLSGTDLATIHGLVSDVLVDVVDEFDDTPADDPDTVTWEPPENHIPWLPHITLAYTEDVDPRELADRVGPVRFDRVRVVFAGEATDIPLSAEPAIPGDGGAPDVASAGCDCFQSRMPQALQRYWIRELAPWGHGSFRRCVKRISKYFPKDPKGTCANLHHEATGKWPGEKRGNHDTAEPAFADEQQEEGTMTTPTATDVVDLDGSDDFHLPGRHDQKAHGRRRRDAAGAAKALLEGKQSIIDGADIPALMKELEDKPPFNLMKIKVSGKGNENLFDRSYGKKPRSEMPQLGQSVEELEPFTAALADKGWEYRLQEVDPRDLQAYQDELSSAKVAKLAGLMSKHGWKKGGVILAARRKDGGLAAVDGHHRWAAAAAARAGQGAPPPPPLMLPVLIIEHDVDEVMEVAQLFSGQRAGMEAALAAAATPSTGDGTKGKFGGRPTHAPPNPNEPWIWVGDRWLLMYTDTFDGVPESLDDLPDSLEEEGMEDEPTTAAAATAVEEEETEPAGDCPPGQHRMEGGDCMPDEAMAVKPVEHLHTWVTEGVSTGLRTFAEDSITWRNPPFAYHYQLESSAHGGMPRVVQVGNVVRVQRDADTVHFWVTLDLRSETALDYARKVAEGFAIWSSVGADESVKNSSIEFVYPETAEGEEIDPIMALFGEPEQLIFHQYRVAEVTGVSVPAMADARVEPTPALLDALTSLGVLAASAVGSHGTATVEGDWDKSVNEKRLPSPMSMSTARGVYAWVDETAVDGGKVPKEAGKFPHHNVSDDGTPGAANLVACSAAIAALHGARGGADIPDSDRRAVYNHVAKHLRDAGQEPPPFENTPLVAAGWTVTIPDLAPEGWFDEPVDMSPHGEIRVNEDGRLWGYLAPASVSHRSFPGKHVRVPMGNVDYSGWQNKAWPVAEGHKIYVGVITMDCGHASTNPGDRSYTHRREHYDNSCSIAAHARIGENRHGVWVAGALAPWLDGERLGKIMSCSLSGDWATHPDRPGWKDFVAALTVPAPGFPNRVPPAVVRVEEGAIVASSVPIRFVHTAATDADADTAGPDMRGTLERLARGIGRDWDSQLRVLHARVHGGEEVNRDV